MTTCHGGGSWLASLDVFDSHSGFVGTVDIIVGEGEGGSVLGSVQGAEVRGGMAQRKADDAGYVRGSRDMDTTKERWGYVRERRNAAEIK